MRAHSHDLLHRNHVTAINTRLDDYLNPGRMWRANWFPGITSSLSTDQTEAFKAITDTYYSESDGPINLIIPAGNYVLNGGASDNPWLINKDGVTLALERGATLIKTVKNRVMIRAGKPSDLSEGDRVEHFRVVGPGLVDGGEIIDDSDNFPCIWFNYVQDGLLEGVFFKDVSHPWRWGDGDLTWSTDNERTLRMRAKGITVENYRWFGGEIFGAEMASCEDIFLIGGALNPYTDNLALRFVKSKSVIADNIQMKNVGRGISTSTDADKPQESLHFHKVIAKGLTVGAGIATSGPATTVFVDECEVEAAGDGVGSGPSSGLTHGMIFGPTDHLEVRNSYVTALSDEVTDLLRTDDCIDVRILGCTLKNIGNAASGTKYAYRCVDLIGLGEFIGNRVDIDYGNGVSDVSGETGAELICRNNTMRGPSFGATPANAFTQSGSSATLTVGNDAGDDNSYRDS